MSHKEEWRDIPGYSGFYQASSLGRLCSFRDQHHKGQRLKVPVILNPTKDAHGYHITIKWEGKQISLQVAKAVALAFLGDIPKGWIAYHKDGNPENSTLRNIGIAPRSELSRERMRRNAAGWNRKPVLKIGRDLTVAEAYPSGCKAAKANGYRPDEMWRFCTLAIAFSVFAPDDFIYTFDDDKWVRKAIQRAKAELDAMNARYNDPFTECYYDLQEAPDLDLDPDILWSEAPLVGGGGVPFWNQSNFVRSVRA